jgi:hypothetical protein
MTPEETAWRRSPDVAFVDDGLRVVALRLDREGGNSPVLLRDVTAVVWRTLMAPRTAAEVADSLASEDDARAQPVGLAQRGLDALLEAGLVVRCPPGVKQER